MSDLYGRAFERVLFPLWETTIRGRPTLAIERELLRTQWQSPDELEALRVASLRRLLVHAVAHVPLYAARAAAVGLDPARLRSTAELARLPLLTRDEAIASGVERRSLAPPLPTIDKKTGGTTGAPLRFAYDAGSEAWRQATKLRGWGWAGYRPGARTLYFWVAAAPTPVWRRAKSIADHWLRRERYLDCSRRSPAHFAHAVDAIRRGRPEVIIAFTQAAVELAHHIHDRGLRDWGTIPILCCAEALSADDRVTLERAFGPAVFETYGCRELMLLGSECDAHAGLHGSAENVILEVVVREGGGERPARPGETGEVALTDLHNLGMPFIRYLNGDLATLAPEGQCACGRWLPRIASVDGRVVASVRGANGARLNGLVFNVVLTPHADKIRQFQAVQHLDDSVTLTVVPGPAFDQSTRASIDRTLRAFIPELHITTVVVDSIPLPRSGKRQIVVVETAPRA